jgi:hypothetical protein
MYGAAAGYKAVHQQTGTLVLQRVVGALLLLLLLLLAVSSPAPA